MAANWCRACGTDGGTGVCSACGTPQDAPSEGEPRVGQVVRIGRALRARTGVVVAVEPGHVRVLAKGADPALVPEEEFQGLAPVEYEGPEVLGAAGRLMRAVQAQRAGTLKAKWDAEAVDAAVLAQASAGMGTRRRAALDALALGLDRMVDAFGLSAAETSWYRAWHAAAARDAERTLYWAERLPVTAYAGKVRLLGLCAPGLLREPDLARRARALLEPFKDSAGEARALSLALAAVPGPVAETATALEDAASGLGRRERDFAAMLARAERLPGPPPRDMALVRSFAAYLAGRRPGAVVDTDELVHLPTPLLDELIDLRTLGGPPTSPRWPADVAAYVRCRLDPGRASARDLEATGFVAEQARRRYLAGDGAGLAALPAADPAVRHYAALLESKAAAAPCRADDLRPDARALLEEVAAIRARTGRGKKAMVSPALAADASCRRLLRDAAGQGRLRPPAGSDGRSPFALWRDLCVLQRRAFDADWEDVALRGSELAARAGHGPVREEALNMVAYAEFRAGRRGAALKILDDALASRRPVGLLVNAGILAAAEGSATAVPYLRSLFASTADASLQRGAVARAIALWHADDREQECPPPLRGFVRDALMVPEDDDGHQRALLAFAAMNDSDWLAAATGIPVLNASQRDAVRYQVVRARFMSDRHDTTLDATVEVLVALRDHDWARQEIRSLARLVDSLIHVPFGEGAHLFPAADALVRGGMLPLAEELVLSVQAGAHLAVKFEDDNATLKEELEQRLLLGPAKKYLVRAAELDPPERGAVGEELGRCLCMAALALSIVTERNYDDFAAEWNALVERERWDYQNHYAIRNSKIALLRAVQPFVTRLESYLEPLGRLPLDEETEDRRKAIAGRVDEWSREVQRLRRGM